MQLINMGETSVLIFDPDTVPKRVLRALNSPVQRERRLPRVLSIVALVTGIPLVAGMIMAYGSDWFDGKVWYGFVLLSLFVITSMALLAGVSAEKHFHTNRMYRKEVLAGHYRDRGIVRSTDYSYRAIMPSKASSIAIWLSMDDSLDKNTQSRIVEFFENKRNIECDKIIASGLKIPEQMFTVMVDTRYLQRNMVFMLYFEAKDTIITMARVLFRETDLENDGHLDDLAQEAVKERQGMVDDLTNELTALNQLQARLSSLQ